MHKFVADVHATWSQLSTYEIFISWWIHSNIGCEAKSAICTL